MCCSNPQFCMKFPVFLITLLFFNPHLFVGYITTFHCFNWYQLVNFAPIVWSDKIRCLSVTSHLLLARFQRLSTSDRVAALLVMTSESPRATMPSMCLDKEPSEEGSSQLGRTVSTNPWTMLLLHLPTWNIHTCAKRVGLSSCTIGKLESNGGLFS